MFVLALSLYNTWNRGVFLLCKITNLLIYSLYDKKIYTLNFRVVRFAISEDSYESIITNLPKEDFPVEEIKKVYAMRWGIETSFRELKYAIGLCCFHSKKVEYIINLGR